jgi:3-oxoacyl-[acyl-carrier-protein] synthase-1
LNPLVATHFTGVNCLGAGVDAWWAQLRAGRSGLAPCAFEDVQLPTYIGRVAGIEDAPVRADLAPYDCRNNRLAQIGLEQDDFAAAVAAARARHGADRIAVVIGTSTSGVLQTERAYQRRDPATGKLPADYRYATTQNTYSIGEFVRRYLDLTGPAHVISTACSSSAKVFSSAARMIAAGLADAAVVGGVDSLCLTTLYGFRSLELLSSAPCRPFDAARAGISIGEGAGFALLERPRGDLPRDAVRLAGVGESCDAYHMSTPHPEGLGAVLAMERALAAANLDAAAIGYVNLHGTATRSNDDTEGLAVHKVFGAATPCSATKGATGHLLGAAGITEAIVAMLSLQRGWLPGTVNTQTVDPECACRVLIAGEPSAHRYALSNSFGFGGNNCSLIFERGER